MAINKVNSLVLASINKVNSLAKASIAKINSLVNVLFTNDYVVSKGLATGSGHYIRTTIPADSPINFKEDDAFTISFWIKAGWNSSLNGSVVFLFSGPSDASSSWDNQIRLFYMENLNRIQFRMLNNPGAGNYDIQAEWLFHANSGAYAEGYAAAGLGTTYWSAANRGNVGDNDFTLITITKSTATAGSGCTLYWNATSCNDASGGDVPPLTSDSSSASMAMVSNEERELVIGSHTVVGSYSNTGNNTETQYNDLAIWNEALTAAEVTAIYNGGTPMDLTSDSGDYTSSGALQVYYQFENNGTANTGAALSGTDYDLTVAGDSNFESL